MRILKTPSRLARRNSFTCGNTKTAHGKSRGSSVTTTTRPSNCHGLSSEPRRCRGNGQQRGSRFTLQVLTRAGVDARPSQARAARNWATLSLNCRVRCGTMPSWRSIIMSCARWCISCSFAPSSRSNRDFVAFPSASVTRSARNSGVRVSSHAANQIRPRPIRLFCRGCGKEKRREGTIPTAWRQVYRAPTKRKMRSTARNGCATRINFETSSSAAEAGVIGVADMSELKLRPPKKGRVEIEIGKEKSGSKTRHYMGLHSARNWKKRREGTIPTGSGQVYRALREAKADPSLRSG